MYRVLLGSSQVLPATSLADAKRKAKTHSGWVQRYEPGTADAPGEWVTVRVGSRAKLGHEDGLNLQAFRRQLGLDPRFSIDDSAPVRQGKVRANVGRLWSLMAKDLYGAWSDMPIVATREALQNSRDAIDARWRRGSLEKDDGLFEVRVDGSSITWSDNGVGMDEDTVFEKFLALAETTKQASGQSAGGFGIAKAVILGVSTTFRWELHTRNRRYVADGFNAPVKAYPAPFYQGTKLTVHDVDPKYGSWWSGNRTLGLADRMKIMLASNDLRPSRSHARVRLLFDGTEIAPMFRHRGSAIGEDLSWGPSTSAVVKAYRRREGGGASYVRLDGLIQFAEGFEAVVPFDVTVDITTKLTPRDASYPLQASRNALSGPAYESYWAMRKTLTADVISAVSKATVEVLEEDEGDPAEVDQNRSQLDGLVRGLLEDPDVVAGLALVKGGAKKLEEQQEQIQGRRARRRLAEQSSARQQTRAQRQREATRRRQAGLPEAPVEQIAPPSSQGTMSGARQQRVSGQKRRRRTNPFAGIAVFKINKAQYKGPQLRKYFEHPERWHPLIAMWRITCQLVLQELGQEAPSFQVGLILDEGKIAQYESGGGAGKRTIYINPEWVAAELRAYKGRPLAIAVGLHAKACHEITHLLGRGAHNEDFVALREQVAIQTVNLLYPLTTLVEHLLEVEPAATPENIEIRRLRATVARLKADRKPMRAKSLVKERMLQAQQRVVPLSVVPAAPRGLSSILDAARVRGLSSMLDLARARKLG